MIYGNEIDNYSKRRRLSSVWGLRVSLESCTNLGAITWISQAPFTLITNPAGSAQTAAFLYKAEPIASAAGHSFLRVCEKTLAFDTYVLNLHLVHMRIGHFYCRKFHIAFAWYSLGFTALDGMWCGQVIVEERGVFRGVRPER